MSLVQAGQFDFQPHRTAAGDSGKPKLSDISTIGQISKQNNTRALGALKKRPTTAGQEGAKQMHAMTSNRTILITGVTGHQGGAVAQALYGSGFHLRGLTRTPDSERAAAVARHGVDIVKGDFDDGAALRPMRRLAYGASSACRTQRRGASNGKKRRASVLRPWRARSRGRTLRLHLSGISGQADGHPALRQQVAH